MENNIWNEYSIDIMLETKEKAIVNLYAKQKHISEEAAKSCYLCSKLRNIVRDKKSALYLESPYYILERYSEYMIPINTNEKYGAMTSSLPIAKASVSNRAFSRLSPLCFELDDLSTAPHYFDRVEKYRLRSNNNEVRKYIIIAGNLSFGEETLARGFAKRYKELGIMCRGELVQIDVDSLLRQYIGLDDQFIDECDLIIILAGNVSILENFIMEYPSFNKDFTNIAHFEQYLPLETLTIYKNRHSSEEMKLFEENTSIKSFLKML